MSRSIFAGPPKPGEDDICASCLRPRHEHCIFVDIELPTGCKCEEIGGWSDLKNIPPVCDKYKGDPEELCDTCEHEFICHKKP